MVVLEGEKDPEYEDGVFAVNVADSVVVFCLASRARRRATQAAASGGKGGSTAQGATETAYDERCHKYSISERARWGYCSSGRGCDKCNKEREGSEIRENSSYHGLAQSAMSTAHCAIDHLRYALHSTLVDEGLIAKHTHQGQARLCAVFVLAVFVRSEARTCRGQKVACIKSSSYASVS